MTDTRDIAALTSVTLWGAVWNIVLTGLKFLAGMWTGSFSLVADGVHSLSDLATDVVTLVMARMARKPPDENHPYGHGKFDTLASSLVALALVAVGAGLAFEAGKSLHDRQPGAVSFWILVVSVISIVSKEALYQVTRQVAQRTGSGALLANAWHHRSDALSSIAVLIGGGAGLLGFPYGDQAAGLVVGVMVAGVGVKLAFGALVELSEASLEPACLDSMAAALTACRDVRRWHHLKSRRSGNLAFVEVTIDVDPGLSVARAHAITEEVEDAVAKALKVKAVVTVHVEPYG